MSDFLSNLLARSLGTAETLRPRVPALFEPYRRGTGRPGARLSGAVVGSQDTGEVSDLAGSATSFRSRPVTTDPPAVQRPSENVEMPGTFVPPRGSLVGRQFSLPALRPLARNSETEMVAGELNSAQPSGDVTEMTKDRRAGNNPAENSLEENCAATRPNAVAGAHGRAPLRFASPAKPFSPNATDANRPVSEVVRLGQASRQARAALPSLGGAMRVPNRLSHSSTEEPAVHVTIGKVEVRAILPDPPARQTAPGKSRPTLSLDDYLARRNRGQR